MSLNRRTFLKAAAGLCAAPLAPLPDDRRPNVVFIISDQLHHRALGAAGNPVIKTPNLDRLAGEGVRFSQAVCATPFCSPTRASFLTGLFPHAHGVTTNVGGDKEGVDPRLPSTEQTLSDNGYVCRQFGKWHLGDRSRILPYKDQPEINYHITDEGGRRQRGDGLGRNGVPVITTDAVKQANARYDGNGAANTLIGRVDLPPEKLVESRITSDAIKELDRSAGRPFFLTVSLPAPHAPWEICEPYYGMHARAGIPLPANRSSVEPVDRTTVAWRFGQLLGDAGLREWIGVYYGLVALVDWNVGRLLAALRERQLERSTLVVFTADHGDMQGGHGMYDKTSFSMYEETTRVPLIIRFPGRIPAGKVVRTHAGSCDIQPTILDYLGFKPRSPIHGATLRPCIGGKEDESRPAFCERERGRQNFQRLIRTSEWKYCFSSTGDSQLYNIAKDPGETRNLAGEASARAIRQELHLRLGRWMQETEDRRKLPEA